MTAAPQPAARPAAQAEGLSIRIPTRSAGRATWVHAATDVDLSLAPGTTTALVGESGGGKSMLASAMCGLLPAGTRVSGALRVAGQEMSRAREHQWRALRGRTVGLATQSGDMSLTPVRTVGSQLAETIAALGARVGVAELLARVGLATATAELYPHELSGGMAQRVALAAALAGRPQVLIADEPTAGLDPALAVHIFALLREAADEGAAVLLISHDLQLVESTGVADRIAVMYAGRIVETGPAAAVFVRPAHDYTAALLAALPSRGLHPIPGTPPELTDLAPDHTFTDRLRDAAEGRAYADRR
ncbi:ABC transporter ATP-binding protein [Georgenia sp. MJ170]|uniref:ABC transporter ATP-binding protein n=1 Tax=Georgenia sunbinii TaxID=3117728 RepID=UPI002F266FDB